MKPTLLLLLTTMASLATGQAALVITEVMSSSAHSGGTNNADWFELTNTGMLDISLAGLSWNDGDTTDANTLFTGLSILGAGQSVIITGEPAGTEASWISDWGLSGVTVLHQGSAFHNFSSSGDSIQIYDSLGATLFQITFGAATTGYSMEWDGQGNFLGDSVVGRNGAGIAVSNGQTNNNGAGVDVASPGRFLVPEPGTAAFCLGSGMAVLIRRRRDS